MTAILVHGAWADESTWRSVSAERHRLGFDVGTDLVSDGGRIQL